MTLNFFKISVKVDGKSVSDITNKVVKIDDEPVELQTVAFCVTDFSEYRITLPGLCNLVEGVVWRASKEMLVLGNHL